MALKILVPLDGSPRSEGIFPLLGRLPAPLEVELLLLRVCPRAWTSGLESAVPIPDEAGEADARASLERIERRLRLGGRPVRSLVRSGEPAEAILRTADEEAVGLIALSTHGRSGLSRLLLGSTAETVLRSARVPLFLSRSFSPDPRPGPFREFLLPLDGGEASRSAIPALLPFVTGVDARVTLLHVLERPGPPPHWLNPGDPEGSAEKELRRALVPVEIELRSGAPADGILEACRGRNADLLVMSTHARSGPARWILGSVTEEVLRRSPLPLLIVPAAARR
jgi:nucleotide-binding universal stress UspA family protein